MPVSTLVDGVYPRAVYDAVLSSQGKADGSFEFSTSDHWKSQPRSMTSPVTEVIRYTFGRAASISSVAFKVRRIGLRIELYYTDRAGKRLPLLQSTLHEAVEDVYADADGDWGDVSFTVHPVVAQTLEIELTRAKDSLSPVGQASVSVKDLLVKRSIETRTDADIATAPYVDALGNTITTTVADWGPDKALDGSSGTFWKSEPQPVPDAVVSLYLDMRDDEGNGRYVDHFFLDPVYADQQLNVYYSNDDTEGAFYPSHGVIAAEQQSSTAYVSGEGLFLPTGSTASWDAGKAGADFSKPFWVGLEWMPTFSYTDNTSVTIASVGAFKIRFNGSEFVFDLGANGSFTVPAEPWSQDDEATTSFAIVLGVSYSGETAGFLCAVKQTGHDTKRVDNLSRSLATLDTDSEELQAWISENGVDTPITAEEARSRLTRSGAAFTPDFSTLDKGQSLVLSVPVTDLPAVGEWEAVITQESSGQYGAMLSGMDPYDAISFQGVEGSWPIRRTQTELVPNPSLDPGSRTQIGTAFTDSTSPTGNARLIDSNGSWLTSVPSIKLAAGESVIFSYYGKSPYGGGKLWPALTNRAGLPSTPLSVMDAGEVSTVTSCRVIEQLADGWARYHAVVTAVRDVNYGTPGLVARKASPFDADDIQMEVAYLSVTRSTATGESVASSGAATDNLASDTGVPSSIVLRLPKNDGTVTLSNVAVRERKAVTYEGAGSLVTLGGSAGSVSWLAVKQASVSNAEADLFLASPASYCAPSDAYADSLRSMVLVGRFEYEESVRGGRDESAYKDKTWTPVFSDWYVARQWYYLPSATLMKYMKLEFTGLTEQPYPVWEDGIKTSYLTYPVSVQQTSVQIATKNTTTTTTTTTVNTTTVNTSSKSGTQSFHDTKVTKNSSSASSYSSSTLPRDYEITVGQPVESSSLPVNAGVTLEKEFSKETANSTLYKGSTSETTTTVPVDKTWTVSHGSKTTKQVAADVYYTVQPGDCLIFIAQKTGIPDWKIIHAINLWVDSDPRLRYLPRRYGGWWIFPGQVLRIPDAVMKTIVVDTTWVEKKSSKTTVKKTVKTDVTKTREVTTSTARYRFRSESVHRYDTRTVERTTSLGYFAAIRDIQVAATSWVDERDTAMFDFSDFATDGFALSGVVRTKSGAYKLDPAYASGTIVSPVLRTVSDFRTVKTLGMYRGSLISSEETDTSRAQNMFWGKNLVDFPNGLTLGSALQMSGSSVVKIAPSGVEGSRVTSAPFGSARNRYRVTVTAVNSSSKPADLKPSIRLGAEAGKWATEVADEDASQSFAFPPGETTRDFYFDLWSADVKANPVAAVTAVLYDVDGAVSPLTLTSLSAQVFRAEADDSGAMWGDTTAVWADQAAAWGSNTGLAPVWLAVTADGVTATAKGDITARIGAVELAAIPYQRSTRTGFTARVTDNAGEPAAVYTLLAVSSTGDILSSRTVQGSVFNAGKTQVLSWEPFFSYSDGRVRFAIVKSGGTMFDMSFTALSVESGTIRVIARNDSEAAWEDITSSIGNTTGLYSFRQWGRSLELRIEMNDFYDWVSSLKVIPLYRPDLPKGA